MIRCLFTIALTFLTLSSEAQSYKFRKYIEQDGLNNRFVYTIDQDQLGNLMVGTGEGLYRYDGFTFTELTAEQGLSDNFLTYSHITSDGSIWYGHNKGLLTLYKNGSFEHFDLSTYTQSRINGICEDKSKNLWVLTQNDGILKMSPDRTWEQFINGIEDVTLYSFCIDSKDRLWLGTDMGLLKAKTTAGGEVAYEYVDEILETRVSSICSERGEIIVGTEDAGIFKITFGESEDTIIPITCRGQEMSWISVNSMFLDNENNLWICSNNKGLIQFIGYSEGSYSKMIHYQDNKQVKTSSMRICMADREGTIWIGTMGDGLLKLTDNYFSIFTFDQATERKQVYSVFEKNDTIWSGGNSEIFVSYEDPINVIDSLGIREGLPACEITSLYYDDHQTLWVGTMSGALLKLPKGKRKFLPVKTDNAPQHQKINDILGFANIVYVATDYGIYQFSGDKLISHISIQSGLSHNAVKSLFRDSQGRIWIATNNSQITYIEDGIIKNIPAPVENMLIQIRCFTEDNLGNIWIGTDGMGLLKISGQDISIINKNDGLYSDYCYSVICDHRNKLWAGHHGAISKVNILNNQIEIIDPSSGFDTDFNDNAAQRTSSGNILFGISEGILRYEPNKDNKNGQEPIIHLNQLMINDSAFNQTSYSLPYGEYKIQFNFVGVSLKNPSKVTYQYYLEGYESEWCEPTTMHSKDYSKLGPGEYTFKLKCFNSDGYGGTTIKEIKIFIDKPFWLKWWFIVLCFLALSLSARYLILRREKNMRDAQERLKKALDQRTREVVEQKELLEEKNKDITDSIQYARNIQKAMLPPIDTLKNYFAETFVYYKPRDIVSGDFYWVEQFEQTIVVSCADCTGHGVPGAFMSLIGSTLLKDVASKKSVQCSRDVLVNLDKELSAMLNKQGDLTIEDGMDIAVFDYNIATHSIKIASANRPVFFYHKGEWHDLKGDRKSIGGSNNANPKEFSQYEFTVQPGDIIYMFSDGITDQFGGDQGKKLKRSGLMNWLKEIVHLNMEEQRFEIKQRFKSWKRDTEQLDDIIMIGIKF